MTPTVEETVQAAIQATLPTADVRYSEEAAEVTIHIPDEEIVSELLGLAVYEMQAAPVSARAVKPEGIEARDARLGTTSDASPLMPKGRLSSRAD
jgi:hypothetical protein